jgi:hypothetical protein
MKEEAGVKHMKGQHVLDSADDDYEDVSCSLKGKTKPELTKS